MPVPPGRGERICLRRRRRSFIDTGGDGVRGDSGSSMEGDSERCILGQRRSESASVPRGQGQRALRLGLRSSEGLGLWPVARGSSPEKACMDVSGASAAVGSSRSEWDVSRSMSSSGNGRGAKCTWGTRGTTGVCDDLGVSDKLTSCLASACAAAILRRVLIMELSMASSSGSMGFSSSGAGGVREER